MERPVQTPPQVASVVGVGFYRHWHVPAPDGRVSVRDAQRADRSVIAPAALAVASVVLWLLGRVGPALLLDDRVTATLTSPPLPLRLLDVCATAGLGLAALWWARAAFVRGRVGAGVARGGVVRIPDDATDLVPPLHAAVTELGRALQRPARPDLCPQAFRLLREATAELTRADSPSPRTRRLRRRCVAMARRLRSGGDAPPEPARQESASA